MKSAMRVNTAREVETATINPRSFFLAYERSPGGTISLPRASVHRLDNPFKCEV